MLLDFQTATPHSLVSPSGEPAEVLLHQVPAKGKCCLFPATLRNAATQRAADVGLGIKVKSQVITWFWEMGLEERTAKPGIFIAKQWEFAG